MNSWFLVHQNYIFNYNFITKSKIQLQLKLNVTKIMNLIFNSVENYFYIYIFVVNFTNAALGKAICGVNYKYLYWCESLPPVFVR